MALELICLVLSNAADVVDTLAAVLAAAATALPASSRLSRLPLVVVELDAPVELMVAVSRPPGPANNNGCA